MVDPHGGKLGRRNSRNMPRPTAGDGPRRADQRPSLRRPDRIGRRRLGLPHRNSVPAGPAHAPGHPHLRPPLRGVGRPGGAAEEANLRRQIEQFVNRVPIESGRMDGVSLSPLAKEGNRYQHYAGRWFSLDSTADERTTRRIIVRVEQIFAAYRQARRGGIVRRPPRLVVFRSRDQYLAFLSSRGVKIGNLACFLEDENVVAVGSDLARLSARMETINRQIDEIRSQLEELKKQLRARLARITAEVPPESAPRRLSTSSSDASTRIIRRRKRNWIAASGLRPRIFKPAPGRCSRESITKHSTPTWRITSFRTRNGKRRDGSTRGWPSCSRAAFWRATRCGWTPPTPRP